MRRWFRTSNEQLEDAREEIMLLNTIIEEHQFAAVEARKDREHSEAMLKSSQRTIDQMWRDLEALHDENQRLTAANFALAQRRDN